MANATINGSGNIDGGKFDNITVNGSANCQNNLEAGEIKINGAFKCNGNIKCNYMNCDGSARFSAGVDINILHCDGSMISTGNEPVKINQINCDGAAKFSSDVITNVIDTDGSFTLLDNCNLKADKIFCDGSIIVNGNIDTDFLNADGFVFARNITSKKLYIRTIITSIAKKILTRRKDTAIDSIISDEIELINVQAVNVTGKDITIGPKCRIEHLECNGTLHIDEKAEVLEITGNYVTK